MRHNYTLHDGRLGIAYQYQELYKLHADERYLSDAVALVKEYFSSSSYQYNIIEKYGLYDGQSGIILLCLKLYDITRDAILFEHLEKLVRRLLYHSRQGEKGIYWGGITNAEKRNIGFGTGNTGIALVLCEIGRYFKNERYIRLAASAFQYEDDVLDNGSQDIDMLSLRRGRTGLLLTRLYCQEMPREKYQRLWASHRQYVCEWWDRNQEQMTETMAPQDLAELALAFFTAYGLTKDKDDLLIAESLWGGGFEEGDRGDKTISIAFFSKTPICTASDDQPNGSIFSSKGNPIGEIFVLRDFRSSLSFLREYDPEGLANFFKASSSLCHDDFLKYAEDVFDPLSLIDPGNASVHAFKKELFRYELGKQCYKYQCNKDEWEIIEIDRIMRKGDEAFAGLRLILSKQVWFFSEDPVISDVLHFQADEFLDFFYVYGKRSYVYKVNPIDKLEESASLGIAKIVLDKFKFPTRVSDVCDWVCDFITSQNEDVLTIMMIKYETTTPSGLRQVIYEFVLQIVQMHFAEGVLVLSEI